MISSTKNPRIQQIRKLLRSSRSRQKAGLFVVEGVRLVEEALSAGWKPELVLITEQLGQRGQQTAAHFTALGADVLTASLHVMEATSDTQTPQGILAVLPLPKWELPKSPTFILILDGVRDPGNLGTLLRTGLAAGVDAVLLPPGNVDTFSPKVVRSGMGAHFKLPVFSMDWETIPSHLEGITSFLADSTAGISCYDTDFTSPLALIIGGEAAGAGSQAAQLASSRVHIPMPGPAESLNAAVAGAILMFEVLRQRG